jgi:hypothetical protein
MTGMYHHAQPFALIFIIFFLHALGLICFSFPSFFVGLFWVWGMGVLVHVRQATTELHTSPAFSSLSLSFFFFFFFNTGV